MPKGKFLGGGQDKVRVLGSKGEEYTVFVIGVSPRACTCPSYEHRNGPAGTDCKHMKARRGSRAIGSTKCVRCLSWLTPEEMTYAHALEIPEGSIPCQECHVV